MKSHGNLAYKIVQIISIVVLVIAILLSGLYFLVLQSLTLAEDRTQIPQIFGYSYAPVLSQYTVDVGVANMGDMLLFKPVTDKSTLTVGNTVLFQKPSELPANLSGKQFSDYCVGIITEIGVVNEIPVFYIQTSKDVPVAINQEIRFEKGAYAIDYLGNFFKSLTSNLGLVYYVIIPVVVFVILQLVAFIIRIFSKQKSDELLDELEELMLTEESGILSSSRIDMSKTQPIPTAKEDSDKEFAPTSPLFTLPKSKTEQSLADIIEEKQTPISPKDDLDIAQSIIQPIEEIPLIDQLIKSETISTLNTDFLPSADPSVDDVAKSYDVLESFLSAPMKPRSFDAMDLLKENHIASNYNNLSNTIEFDLELAKKGLPVDEQVKQYEKENYIKVAETFSMNNSISVDLKETAVDFDFKNILSTNIEIERSDDGTGFTIKTPNYKANIKVEITK